MNKTFTPINILWIEDNPLWKRTKCSEITDTNEHKVFDSSLDDEFVPVIEFTNGKEGSEKYFSLKVLQHPEEIKEYYSLCLFMEDKFGTRVLSEAQGVVPEMVVFDYKLSENITVNLSDPAVFSISYSGPTTAIRKFVNPNFALLEKFPEQLSDFKLFLENPENSGYDDTDFIKRVYSPDQLDDKEIEAIKLTIRNDEFGLYGGLEIVKHFRQHPCVGIPATANKADKKLLHPLSRHYEWLNEKDLSTALDRKERDNKSWNAIVADGVLQLRTRIKALIECSKIIPSLSQLLELCGGTYTDKVFVFNSVYGERSLPLDGLFFDVETEKRGGAIVDFAKECLTLHLQNANEGLTKDVLDASIKFAATLLTQYDMKDKLLERIRFSQLYQKAKNEIITTIQQTELDGIYSKLGMSKGDENYKDCFDLRAYTGSSGNLVRRYAALFSMVNLYKRFSEFKASNSEKKEFIGKPYLFTQPDKMDYLLVIYPRPADPLIMPLHGKSDGHDKSLRRITSPIPGTESGLLIASVLNCKEDGGITKGEKVLLQSYAKGIGMNKDSFADWFI